MSEFSEEIYHRLYRLAQKGTDPKKIAVTLNIPLKTVNNLLARLEQAKKNSDSREKEIKSNDSFLDIYIYSKTRYAVINLVGYIDAEQEEKVSREFAKLLTAQWKAVAIKMTDVTTIDKDGAQSILQFFDKMQSHGRFVAVLDPSTNLDESLKLFGIDGKIKIFGTERAFEDAAFSSKTSSSLWKNRS